MFYEAEEGRRTGGAGLNTDHPGYSGVGFVDGMGTLNAATTIHVTVSKAGAYDVALRYSNGPNPFTGTKTISVYVNGRKVKQTSLPSTSTWDNWATVTESLTLKKGINEIQYRVDAPDTGHVNLDLITVRPPGERIVLFDGTNQAEWQHTDGRTASWPLVGGGAMEVAGGDLRTKQAFGDYRLHAEFKVPLLPPRRDRAEPRQQRRLPAGAVRDPDPRLVRRHHPGQQRGRRHLHAEGAGQQRSRPRRRPGRRTTSSSTPPATTAPAPRPPTPG